MEVVYTSEGRQTMHIGARLPYEGESIETVVGMYSPVAFWREQAAAVVAPAVGTTGALGADPAPLTLEIAKANKVADLADDRWQAEESAVQVYGALILTDRDSRAALSNASMLLQSGAVETVTWKAANKVWLDLSITEINTVVQAVALHVENCFVIEKQLVDLVKAATTIEAVEAIKWPQ
jgi:hypothetical protein